jgi:hypothetical protein
VATIGDVVYVQRDAGGAIVDVCARPQPGRAEEAMPADDPAVVAYLAAPQAAVDAQASKESTFKTRAAAAVDTNNTYVARASPTNAQTVEQVKELSRQMNAVLRRLTRTD